VLRWLRTVERDASTRDKVIALLPYYAGLRIGEVIALDVEDVRISARRGEIRVLGKGRDGGKTRGRRRTHLLGVMMDVRNTFHAELVEDLHEAVEELDYDLVLSTVTRSRTEHRAVETLLDFRCEAVILLGPTFPAAQLVALNQQLPVIAVGRRIAAPGIDVIRTADDKGVARAVAHLVQLGHRTIAFLDGGQGAMAPDRRRGSAAPCATTASASTSASCPATTPKRPARERRKPCFARPIFPPR
jgi:hypothetical protein